MATLNRSRYDSRKGFALLFLLCLLAPTSSFLAHLSRSLRPIRRLNGEVDDSNSRKTTNSEKSSQVTANGEKKKRRRRKNADFPRFAYDRDDPYGVKGKDFTKQLMITYRMGQDKELHKAKMTKSVSVRQPGRKSDNLLMRVAQELFGPGFVAGGFGDNERVLPIASQTRLLTERAYARQEPFAAENITVPPSLDDLAARPREPFEGFWISTSARVLSFGLSSLSFPFLTRFLDSFVTMPPEQLDDITSKFGPGISILYGTFISLTLSILYNRQRDIQDNVATECALITIVTRTMLSLFKDSREMAIEAGQCAADQVRTLVRSSRGAELMLVMYSDPYARMLELLDRHEDGLFEQTGSAGRSAQRLVYARDTIKDLNRVRAMRLSDESLALPPTHFLILNILTVLILLGYTISILPSVTNGGEPSFESSLLFGVLTSIYVLFYNFAYDLNNPFRGVYQVRRSCAASHLLEAKWLIANHPLLQGEVDFEEVDEESPGVLIRSPGLGDFWFERTEFYVDFDNKDDDKPSQDE